MSVCRGTGRLLAFTGAAYLATDGGALSFFFGLIGLVCGCVMWEIGEDDQW